MASSSFSRSSSQPLMNKEIEYLGKIECLILEPRKRFNAFTVTSVASSQSIDEFLRLRLGLKSPDGNTLFRHWLVGNSSGRFDDFSKPLSSCGVMMKNHVDHQSFSTRSTDISKSDYHKFLFVVSMEIPKSLSPDRLPSSWVISHSNVQTVSEAIDTLSESIKISNCLPLLFDCLPRWILDENSFKLIQTQKQAFFAAQKDIEFIAGYQDRLRSLVEGLTYHDGERELNYFQEIGGQTALEQIALLPQDWDLLIQSDPPFRSNIDDWKFKTYPTPPIKESQEMIEQLEQYLQLLIKMSISSPTPDDLKPHLASSITTWSSNVFHLLSKLCDHLYAAYSDRRQKAKIKAKPYQQTFDRICDNIVLAKRFIYAKETLQEFSRFMKSLDFLRSQKERFLEVFGHLLPPKFKVMVFHACDLVSIPISSENLSPENSQMHLSIAERNQLAQSQQAKESYFKKLIARLGKEQDIWKSRAIALEQRLEEKGKSSQVESAQLVAPLKDMLTQKEAKVTELESKMKELMTLLKDQKQEFDNQQQRKEEEIQALQQQKTQEMQQLQAKTQEITRLQAQVEEMQKSNSLKEEGMLKLISTKDAELQTLSSQLEQVRKGLQLDSDNTIESLRQKIAALEAEQSVSISQRDQQISSLKKELSTKTDDFEILKAEHSVAISERDQQISTLKNQLSTKSFDLENLRAEIANNEQKFTTNSSQTKSLSAELEICRTQLNQYISDSSMKDHRISTLLSQVDRLTSLQADTIASLKRCEAECQTLNESISAAGTELNHTVREMHKLQNEKNELNKKLNECQDKCAVLELELDDSKQRYQEMLADSKMAQQEIEDADLIGKSDEELRQMILNSKKILAKVEEIQDDTQATIKNLVEENEDLKAKLQEHIQQQYDLSASVAQMVSFEEENMHYKNEIEQLQNRITQLREEIVKEKDFSTGVVLQISKILGDQPVKK